jgi:hypothetical protein
MSDEEDYADDFEEYNEEFDEEPSAAVTSPPLLSNNSLSKQKGDAGSREFSEPVKRHQEKSSREKDLQEREIELLQKSIELENIAAKKIIEEKGYRSDVTNVDKSKKAAKSFEDREKSMAGRSVGNDQDHINMEAQSKASIVKPNKKLNQNYSSLDFSSLSLSAFHPKAKRIASLIANNVYDLQEEKFTNFQLAPLTPLDFYHKQLRAAAPSIKQTGTPGELITRDVEIVTDEIDMVDKEMQFCYGDETSLLNAVKFIKERRRARKSERKSKKEKFSNIFEAMRYIIIIYIWMHHFCCFFVKNKKSFRKK